MGWCFVYNVCIFVFFSYHTALNQALHNNESWRQETFVQKDALIAQTSVSPLVKSTQAISSCSPNRLCNAKKNRSEFMILTHFYRPYSTMAELFISSVSSVSMACVLISLRSLDATFPLLRVSLKRGNEDTWTWRKKKKLHYFFPQSLRSTCI